MNSFKMYILLLCSLCWFGTGCEVAPEPIAFGKDACHHCKMLIMDPKFGAELVTEKGRVYKFDDVNCMLQFRNGGEIGGNVIKFEMVVAIDGQQGLIDVASAHFLCSDDLKTPMGSKTAAFAKEETMHQFLHTATGQPLTWEEVQSFWK